MSNIVSIDVSQDVFLIFFLSHLKCSVFRLILSSSKLSLWWSVCGGCGGRGTRFGPLVSGSVRRLHVCGRGLLFPVYNMVLCFSVTVGLQCVAFRRCIQVLQLDEKGKKKTFPKGFKMGLWR